jgi:hypothetical protein
MTAMSAGNHLSGDRGERPRALGPQIQQLLQPYSAPRKRALLLQAHLQIRHLLVQYFVLRTDAAERRVVVPRVAHAVDDR